MFIHFCASSTVPHFQTIVPHSLPTLALTGRWRRKTITHWLVRSFERDLVNLICDYNKTVTPLLLIFLPPRAMQALKFHLQENTSLSFLAVLSDTEKTHLSGGELVFHPITWKKIAFAAWSWIGSLQTPQSGGGQFLQRGQWKGRVEGSKLSAAILHPIHFQERSQHY